VLLLLLLSHNLFPCQESLCCCTAHDSAQKKSRSSGSLPALNGCVAPGVEAREKEPGVELTLSHFQPMRSNHEIITQ